MKLIPLYSLTFGIGMAVAFGVACLIGLLLPGLKFPFFIVFSIWWVWNIYTVWKRACARSRVIESTCEAMTEYNKLRASVGMAPARDDDFCEAVAWVVVSEFFAPGVANECKTLPVEEHGVFMMAYAAYLSWLAMGCVESKFPPGSWRRIAPLIGRELSKQPWYQAHVTQRVFDSMVEHPPTGRGGGRYFKGSLGPWPDVIIAANIAGYTLKCSTNAKFILSVVITSTKVLETIAKMAPAECCTKT